MLQALARQPGEQGTRSLGEVIRLRLAAPAGTDDDSDPRLRDAIDLLGARRANALAATVLEPALAARDAGARYATVEALGAIGCPCSMGALSRTLATDAEPMVAAAALQALVRAHAIEPDALRGYLVDPRAPVRSAAARAWSRTAGPGNLREAPAEATEVHALRLLAAARRRDCATLGEFVHPMRHLEVWEEDRRSTFSARTITPSMLRQEVAPVLAAAQELADSLSCGARREGGEQRCAVYDDQGYVTELHFSAVLGRVYLLRVKHHGGYADL